MKKILLPTDFSKNALNAARYALDLYKEEHCFFYIFHVFHAVGYSLDSMLMVPEPGELTYEAAREQSEEGLERFLGMLKVHAENPGHQFETISTYNSLVEGVKNQIAQKDIDLVIMGTRGATDTERVLFGTNAVHVMEDIRDCPVLVIPSGYRFQPPQEIVFPTDFKISYKSRELKYLLEFAAAHQANVQVLYIDKNSGLSREQKDRMKLLEEILQETSHEYHTLQASKVARGIGAFVSERRCDMIVFMNPKHSFLEKLLSRPLVKELGYHYQIPILELNVWDE